MSARFAIAHHARDDAEKHALVAMLRALEGKDARAPVELRPLAVSGAPGEGPYVAAVMIATAGKPPSIVYGDERFTDKASCEAHAIRVANSFAQCRAWNKKHAFTVTVRGCGRSALKPEPAPSPSRRPHTP